MAAQPRHSDAIENYAKAIYAIARRTGGPVSTNELAERLSVTAASVSAMSKKLADRGLVEHVPYRGVVLTRRGGEGRAGGPAPPPAARALPGRAPRRAVGPRPRRGRGARARHLRGPRGAHRGEAGEPDPRPPRRPDPGRGPPHRRGDDPQPGRSRARRPRRVRPCVGHRSGEAALPRRARRAPGRHLRGPRAPAVRRAAHRPLRRRTATSWAAGWPTRCASCSNERRSSRTSTARPTSWSSGTSTRPRSAAEDVLVRVAAAGVDRGVWHVMTGLPYPIRLAGYGLRAPKTPVLGHGRGRRRGVGRRRRDQVPGRRARSSASRKGAFAEYARAAQAELAAQAGEPHAPAGGRARRLRLGGAAGAARPRQGPGGPARADHRRVGRRRDLRRADAPRRSGREVTARVQHVEGRHGPVARCRTTSSTTRAATSPRAASATTRSSTSAATRRWHACVAPSRRRGRSSSPAGSRAGDGSAAPTGSSARSCCRASSVRR